MNKKKVLIISIAIAVLLVAAVCVGLMIQKSSGEAPRSDVAYVSKISDLNGLDTAFSSNRYSGTVEMGDVVSVKADKDKVIKETFVKEGDTVKKGDKLFEYDVEQLNMKLSQTKLDLEQAKSQITSAKNQIAALESEKENADENHALSIDSQILELQFQIKSAEYTVTSKQDEINKLNDSINNNVVKSTVDGKVQKIASEDSNEKSDSNAYMTIATNDEYKVTAAVSEEHIQSLYENAPVIIRSRNDETKTWTGVITSIDTSKPIKNDDSSANGVPSNGMGNSADDATDSKYPVHINIDNADGLLVGQHVTVELDVKKANESKDLTIQSSYILDAETNPYVWCQGENGKLEKRSIELGEFDEETSSYKIVSGITKDDYIAFPESHFSEGMETKKVESSFDEQGEDTTMGVL